MDGAIAFRNVSFVYARREGIGAPTVHGVEQLDLVIEPGQVIGITGPSGAGKTTLADLLVSLIAPQTGVITIGGTALRGAVLNAWRNRVSYVAQDPFLFHDTIRRNLRWANAQASEQELWDALALAGADAFVRETANGLDTVVGERGTLMSGGERQRIALARAVLRQPRLLVLDEATNAIDIAGEQEILARLLRLKPRPTMVIIAHRPETLAMCDYLFIFDHGRLTIGPAKASVAHTQVDGAPAINS